MHTAKNLILSGFVAVLAMLAAVSAQAKPVPATAKSAIHPEAKPMKIFSPDFADGQPIPARFTCDGEDISPALAWSGVPAQAKSLALVCEDPDAPSGLWVHWIVVNIPVAVDGFPAGGPLPAGVLEVNNDFHRPEYGGPCPPGGTHRYYFKLLALNVPAVTGITRATYAQRLAAQTIAQAEWMGTYRRK